MAFTDIQNKVGQTQMANQILLAQSKIPPPNEGEGTRDYRKRISGGSYKNKPNKNNPYAGMTDDEQRIEAAKRQEALNKKREEERLDQDPELNKQREDMRQGDYLEDPENPHLNNLMKIGGAAAGFGGNLLRMLINPLGGNAMAMNFEDTGLSEGGFISTDKPHIYINSGAEAYILEPNGNFKFDGFYDPARHGNAFPGLGLVQNQRNDDMKIAKLPHSPPTEKIVLPNGKMMDSPLRFKTDQERIKFMEDFSRGYGRYS